MRLIPKRGIRQGNPLSLYLFIICVHGLSEMFCRFKERKLFRGVRIGMSVSHLFFVDYSLILFRAISHECTKLKICLDVYKKASGKLVKFEKLALSFM